MELHFYRHWIEARAAGGPSKHAPACIHGLKGVPLKFTLRILLIGKGYDDRSEII